VLGSGSEAHHSSHHYGLRGTRRYYITQLIDYALEAFNLTLELFFAGASRFVASPECSRAISNNRYRKQGAAKCPEHGLEAHIPITVMLKLAVYCQ
jgi:hypothetical protein